MNIIHKLPTPRAAQQTAQSLKCLEFAVRFLLMGEVTMQNEKI